jgi:hypothetical protein
MRRLASQVVLFGGLLALMPAAARAQETGGPTVRDSSVGYIDSALVGDVFRFRYDDSFNLNRPDRGEFFWAGGKGKGPASPEIAVGYTDLSAYLEQQFAPRVSAFAELPVRFLHPELNEPASGLADMNAGFKAELVQRDHFVGTFQLRAYFPTGDVNVGLGNDRYTLEPALLWYWRLTGRCAVECEFRDWVPIQGTDFTGNVLRYGVGVHYDLFEFRDVKVVPVAEFVGWTELGGKVSALEPDGSETTQSAAGDTIVNVKLGCRFKLRQRGDVYFGYGRPLTGDRWYDSTYRLEFRLFY